MRSVIYLLPLLVMVLTACSSDSSPFGPYKTAFQIKSGCTLNVDKSKVSAGCSDVNITANMTTEEVTLTSAQFTESIKGSECFDAHTCQLLYRGLANKKGGGSTKKDAGSSGTDGASPTAAPDDTADGGAAAPDAGPKTSSNKGLFTPLEGSWSGKLRLDRTCGAKLKSGAPAYCNAKAKETIQYEFTATVERHKVTFTWSGDNGSSGTFDVVETKGGVRAAGTFYPRAEAKTSKDTGAPKADGA